MCLFWRIERWLYSVMNNMINRLSKRVCEHQYNVLINNAYSQAMALEGILDKALKTKFKTNVLGWYYLFSYFCFAEAGECSKKLSIYIHYELTQVVTLALKAQMIAVKALDSTSTLRKNYIAT